MTPLVSVIMPVRNGARWLDEAIDSVTRQTLRELELLVIDSASTDGTPQILDDWSRRDSRIRVLRQSDFGLATALNCGLAEACGRYVARLDADDCAVPSRLERQVLVLQQSQHIGLLGSWADRIDEDGRPRGQLKPEPQPKKLAELIRYGNPMIHSSVMLRPEIVRDLGGYRAAFEAAEDYDLWLRMSEVTSLANVAEPLVRYRRHSKNVSTTKTVRQSFSTRLAQRAGQIRRQTGRDPAGNLVTPPDWRLPEALNAFYAEEAVIYRLLELADPDFSTDNGDADLAPLLQRCSELSPAERRLAAGVMTNRLRRAPWAAKFQTCLVLAKMICQRPEMALLAARSLSRQ